MKRLLVAGGLFAAWMGCGEPASPPPTPATVGAGGVGGGGGASTTSSAVTTVGTGGSLPELPAEFEVSGVVTDLEGTPIEAAIVVQGGRTEAPVLTASDGSFTLDVQNPGPNEPVVVATKEGFRSWGLEIQRVDEPLLYALRPTEENDNPTYEYGASGDGDDLTTAFCGHCHNTFAKQFKTSKHAEAGRNPKVHDLYAGVASAFTSSAACTAAGGQWRAGQEPGQPGVAAFRCYLGAGTLPDLNPSCGGPGQARCDDPTIAPVDAPVHFGACADCHAPAMGGPVGGRSYLEAEGLAYEEGVHCDFCHKVADIDLSLPPGVGGALVLRRPSAAVPNGTPLPVMYGPLVDVANPFMGASHQPKFSGPLLCAGCHQQRQDALLPNQSLDPVRWPQGLPIHTTYEEWQVSGYGQNDVSCQFCHMQPETSIQSSADLATPETAGIVFGFPRPPEQIRQHDFRGPLDETDPLLATAAAITFSANVGTNDVTIEVAVANSGCGHALPTGEPMRAMVLLVQTDACGSALVPLDGPTVDDLGGALAIGTADADATVAGTTITWGAGALAATVGKVVRVVRPTGSFEDYPGVGFFAAPSLTPADKGRPAYRLVGEAEVTAVGGASFTVDAALPVQAGDRLYLGEALAVGDAVPSGAYAGALGTTFGKVLVDADGNRQVPHFAAIDVVSDNRIPSGVTQSTSYRFALPGACPDATITATLLYRPHPLAEARRRGWDGRDHLVTEESVQVSF